MPAVLMRIVLAALLLGAVQSSQAATVQIRFEGLEDELRDAARASLDLQKFADREDTTPTQVRRAFDRADEQIAEALQPYGYYSPQVASDLQRGEAPDSFVANFKVDLGAPVVVRESSIRIEGDARTEPDLLGLLNEFQPAVGDPLEHAAYENSKSLVNTLLRGLGYFDSELLRHRVEVVQSANTAAIDLEWQSGERYRFGEVQFSDSQFSDDFLKRYVPWKEGDYYSADELLTLQQRLVDADYFATVSVQPIVSEAANGEVPIETLVLPAKRTVYTAGAYVSTDSGPGIRLGFDRRWLNKRGHKFGAQIEYSQRLEQISATYRIPKPGERNRNYTIGGGYRDEETDTSRSRMARFAASEVLDEWHDYTRTLGFQYLNGDFEIADRQQSTSLLFGEAMLTRKRADDLMFPKRGFSVLYGLRFAAESLMSDTSFAQLRAEAKWIRPLGERGRFISRAALGAMAVSDFNALPPELRFFAGGDRSVRGFDYQAIGETNDEGGVIGGEYLTTASAEYEHFFLPTWGAAVFVDGGDAYSTEFNANIGAGIGLRWRSPVGLVRVDVAVPVVSDLEDGVRFHILIGPDL